MSKVAIWPVNLSVTLTRWDLLQKQIGVRVRLQVKDLAEQILMDSRTVPPTVPVEPDDVHSRRHGSAPHLRDTGRVEQVEGGFAVRYGTPVVDYANQVHDDLRPRKYTVPGSGPKFVEAHYLRRTGIADVEFDKALAELVKEVGL